MNIIDLARECGGFILLSGSVAMHPEQLEAFAARIRAEARAEALEEAAKLCDPSGARHAAAIRSLNKATA